MNDKGEAGEFSFCEDYPWHIVVIRWIVLLAAFALGVYVLLEFHQVFALIYVLYSVMALTFVLPLSRCVSCFYHGKVCNTGWGKIAAYLFAKGDEANYVDYYSYALLLHLLWLVPLLVVLLELVRKRDLLVLLIFVIYVSLLLLERVILKKLCCKRCHQREFCPALPFRKIK